MWIWVALFLVASVGCRPEPSAPVVTPPTLAQAEAFGNVFAKNLTSCDPVKLEESIDFGFMFRRATAGRKMTDESAKAMHAGMQHSFNGESLCRDLRGMSYTHLRTQQIDGVAQPLLRGIGDSGLNYMRLELDHRDGRVRVADIYVATLGERMSDLMRRTADTLTHGVRSGDTATFNRATAAARAGNVAEARRLIRELSPAFRKMKAVMLMELRLTSDDNTEYLAALDRFVAAFPGDPAARLQAIDRAVLRNEISHALDLLEEVDRFAGGDPYLDTMRAGIFLHSGNPAEALKAAKRATASEPSLKGGWWTLATAQTAIRDFTGALATIEELRDRFAAATDAESLRADPRFTALVGSPEYAAWSKQ